MSLLFSKIKIIKKHLLSFFLYYSLHPLSLYIYIIPILPSKQPLGDEIHEMFYFSVYLFIMLEYIGQ